MPKSLSSSHALLALVLLVPALAAQEREPYVPDQERPAADDGTSSSLPNAIEFAIGGDALWFAYRNGLHRGEGYFSAGFLSNEDDDLAMQARLMRFTEPAVDAPIGLGLGLGCIGARLDDPDDELFAITITCAADYQLDETFDLRYPMRAGLEFSYAPNAATFMDGTRVVDVLGRVEVDLSSWATAFVGYRHLEVDLEDEDDAELDSALHAGVRLGW